MPIPAGTIVRFEGAEYVAQPRAGCSHCAFNNQTDHSGSCVRFRVEATAVLKPSAFVCNGMQWVRNDPVSLALFALSKE